MKPILYWISIGDYSIPIPGYGVMMALGFSVSLILIIRRARVEGLDTELFLNAATYVILAALLGARFFHVLIEQPSYYFAHPLEAFKVWKGGYTFYGGMLVAIGVLIWYLKKEKMPILKSLDICAPYLALGQVFGRIGCMLAGCCYGKVCSFVLFPISYIATDPASFSRPMGVPLYATQVWHAFANLIVFLILMSMRKRKQFDGQLVVGYFLIYPVFRIFIEVFRGDDIRGFLIPGLVSTSQFIGGLMMICGAILWRRLRKRSF